MFNLPKELYITIYVHYKSEPVIIVVRLGYNFKWYKTRRICFKPAFYHIKWKRIWTGGMSYIYNNVSVSTSQ